MCVLYMQCQIMFIYRATPSSSLPPSHTYTKQSDNIQVYKHLDTQTCCENQICLKPSKLDPDQYWIFEANVAGQKHKSYINILADNIR